MRWAGRGAADVATHVHCPVIRCQTGEWVTRWMTVGEVGRRGVEGGGRDRGRSYSPVPSLSGNGH